METVLTEDQERILEDAFADGCFRYDGVPHISYAQTAAVEQVISEHTKGLIEAVEEQVARIVELTNERDRLHEIINDHGIVCEHEGGHWYWKDKEIGELL